MPAQFPSGRAGRLSGPGAPIMSVDGVTRLLIRPTVKALDGAYGAQFNSSRQRFYGRFSISGVTRDVHKNPLANCEVHLFQTGSNALLGITFSDGSGNYSFSLGSNSSFYYIVAYLPGGIDVAGTTVNTLVAV